MILLQSDVFLFKALRFFLKRIGDKIFEKVKFDRLKTIILKSITKDIEDLSRNELLRNKYTWPEKSSDKLYKKEVNMLREGLKSKDFIIKELLQTIKEMKIKLSQFKPIHHACLVLKVT